MTVRLEWDGKPTQVERLWLPFQTVETINQSRTTRELYSGSLLRTEEIGGSWRNRLIWGDNRFVMSSLLAEFAGQIQLVYIDPPFATGDNFSMRIQVGDAALVKEPSILEEHAYRDTWGAGYESYLTMMYARLVQIRELLHEEGALFLHCGPTVSHTLRVLCDEIFGEENFRNEIVWKRFNSTQRRKGSVE